MRRRRQPHPARVARDERREGWEMGLDLARVEHVHGYQHAYYSRNLALTELVWWGLFVAYMHERQRLFDVDAMGIGGGKDPCPF